MIVTELTHQIGSVIGKLGGINKNKWQWRWINVIGTTAYYAEPGQVGSFSWVGYTPRKK
jgi:hypothetical protein